MIIRTIHPKIEGAKGAGVELGAPLVDFLASDETVDRYHEVITAAGWDLTNYRKNPVFQNSHNYSDVIFTLGKAEITEVRGASLFQRVRFAVNENPMAKIAHAMYAGGFLSAVSVGFIPLDSQDGKPGETFQRKFLKQELLEVSAVSIPANPNALALAVKSGAVEKGDIKELAQLLKHLCKDFGDDDTEGSQGDSGAKASGTDLAQLLSLMRSTNAVLKKA